MEDPHRRARVGAVLAIVAALDIPLVVMATRWFRGIHPVSPDMEPSMRLVLLLSLSAFTALFTMLVARRRVQLRLEGLIGQLERRLGTETSTRRERAAPAPSPEIGNRR